MPAPNPLRLQSAGAPSPNDWRSGAHGERSASAARGPAGNPAWPRAGVAPHTRTGPVDGDEATAQDRGPEPTRSDPDPGPRSRNSFGGPAVRCAGPVPARQPPLVSRSGTGGPPVPAAGGPHPPVRPAPMRTAAPMSSSSTRRTAAAEAAYSRTCGSPAGRPMRSPLITHISRSVQYRPPARRCGAPVRFRRAGSSSSRASRPRCRRAASRDGAGSVRRPEGLRAISLPGPVAQHAQQSGDALRDARLGAVPCSGSAARECVWRGPPPRPSDRRSSRPLPVPRNRRAASCEISRRSRSRRRSLIPPVPPVFAGNATPSRTALARCPQETACHLVTGAEGCRVEALASAVPNCRPGHARCHGESRPLCDPRGSFAPRESWAPSSTRVGRIIGRGTGGGGGSPLDATPRCPAAAPPPARDPRPRAVSIFRRNDKSHVSDGPALVDIVPEGLVHCLTGLSTPLTFRTSWHSCARRPVAGVPGFAQVTLTVTVSFSVILIGVTQW